MKKLTRHQKKEIAIQIGIIGAGLMLCIMSHAQQGRRPDPNGGGPYQYDGADAGIQRYPQLPRLDMSYCESQRAPIEAYQACVKGLTAAYETAQKVGDALGTLDGFHRGYTRGLFYGLDQVANPKSNNYTTIVNAAQYQVQSNQQLNNIIAGAVSNVYANAQVSGAQRGNSDAILLFKNFVDSGASKAGGIPSRNIVSIPIPQYSSSYPHPYSTLVDTRPISIERVMQDFQFEQGDLGFIDQDRDYLNNDRPNWHMNDMYSQQGNFSVTPASYKNANPDTALALCISSDNLCKGVYESLAKPRVQPQPGTTAPVPAPGSERPGMAGQRPAVGNPQVIGNRPAQNPPATNPVTVVVAPPIDVNAIFKDAFKRVYTGYFNAYHSVGYYREAPIAANMGYSKGRAVGTQYDNLIGTQAGFNSQFEKSESASLVNGFSDGYQKGAVDAQQRQIPGFYATYDDRLSHPYLEFAAAGLVGKTNDGNIEPNEAIQVTMSIKNYGGVPFPNLSAAITGDVSSLDGTTNSVPMNMGSIPRFSNQAFSSGFIALVTSKSDQNANIVVNVNGTSVSFGPVAVKNQVTIGDVQLSSDVPHGSVNVAVTLVNNSTVLSRGIVQVTLTDNYNHKVTQVASTQNSAGTLGPREQSVMQLNLSGFSPLDLLANKLSTRVQVSIGTTVEDVADGVGIRLDPSQHNNLLAQSFGVAALDSTKKDLVNQISSVIFSELETEAKGMDTSAYKGRDGTLIKALLSTKQAQTQSQTAASLAAYSQLSDTLYPIIKEMKGPKIKVFAKQSDNQKYLQNQLDVLAAGNASGASLNAPFFVPA